MLHITSHYSRLVSGGGQDDRKTPGHFPALSEATDPDISEDDDVSAGTEPGAVS